ncbi:hypothetical protein B9W14_07035 [Clostridium drakei]|uniref:histidine kinase n=1 Tax=Clostridium drakei TaxID=332101 RepID=A0A2U8DNL6_9CLOT|nr:hypothetical protein B9W14_07035 [Clostridium drakei]
MGGIKLEILRESGIKGLGKISWSTHMCMFYLSRDDFSDILVNYIKAGLENDELCIWVYSGIDKNVIIKILKKSINNIEQYIMKHQLLLIPYIDWYINDDNFHRKKVTNRWLKYIELAKTKGFVGVKAIGDIGWIDKNLWFNFSDCETHLNNIIDNFPFTIICLYNLLKCTSFQIADVIRNHKYTLIKSESEWSVLKNSELELKENNKILEEALESNKIRTEFFSNISHELKTPLTIILSALQLLNEKSSTHLNEKINENTEKKYIDIIKQNSYRLLRLVNNIIDLTKIDSNFFDIQLKNLNIVEVVENIVLSVAQYIKSNGIKITFDTNVEEKIMAIDIDQFERIILNLISNAIKFSKPEGNIWVSLYDRQDHIIISVKDDGKGIPEDKLPIIFERFYQIDKSLSRECEGSGVGLAIVKSLVEKHSGKITVNSTLGLGSEFTMKFPIRIIPEKMPISSSTLLNENQNCMEKVNIEFSDIYSI